MKFERSWRRRRSELSRSAPDTVPVSAVKADQFQRFPRRRNHRSVGPHDEEVPFHASEHAGLTGEVRK